MEDVFSGDSFLLYSPAITRTLKEKPILLWFNLIAYNGACFQTYGPIGAYTGFEPDDILFFATELRPHLESEADIMEDVEANPFPYMMLIAGAALPMTYHQEDQIVQLIATHDLDDFTTDLLESDFVIEYIKDIYRLTLKQWDEYPHYATAYYDEKRKVLTLTALTDRGFEALVRQLNALGLHLPGQADIRVGIPMVSVAGDMLKSKIRLNPYESLFAENPEKHKQGHLNRLNSLLARALPDINAGREPDIEALAAEAGIDVESARAILESAISRINELRNR